MNKKERIEALNDAINCIKDPETKAGSMMVLDIYEVYLDRENVGTDRYQGLAYFWGQEYKHVLRELAPSTLRKIHRQWIEAGLDLDGDSPEHEAILNKAITPAMRKARGWGKVI